MFIADLFEDATKPGLGLVVIYAGRFQPFHLGHQAVFAQLQGKYGRDRVWIATSNKTDAGKSPFNFADKQQLMHAAGVPADRILEITDNLYSMESYKNILGFDPERTAFVVAVGAPDRDRLNPDSVIKRDQKDKTTGAVIRPAGSPGYFKTLQNHADVLPAAEHGYVIIVPEVQKAIVINGQEVDVSHGTECRNLWNAVRNQPKLRTEFLKQLYGRSTPELIHIFNKIPAPAGMSEASGPDTGTGCMGDDNAVKPGTLGREIRSYFPTRYPGKMSTVKVTESQRARLAELQSEIRKLQRLMKG